MTSPVPPSSAVSDPRRGGTGDLLSPVSIGRISEVIVDQIRLLIRQGQLRAGDRLPSERELCERFGVSRVTVREALRVLEANGLVEIRVGARGGAFVTAPTSRRVGEGIVDLISLATISSVEVTEARLVFELGIVPLVCERATAEDVAALTDICDQAAAAIASDGGYPLELSAAWHTRYAESAHNRAISMFVESLHDPLLRSLQQARVTEPTHGAGGVDEHRALVELISARDVAGATELMGTHLRRTADRVAAGQAASTETP